MKFLLTNLILLSLIIGCTSPNTFELHQLPNVTSNSASLPRLFTDNTGTVFISWVETENDTSTLFYSKLVNNEWLPKQEIAASDSWFVNWADYPSIIAKDGNITASHWLKKIPGGTYSYNVTIASAFDNWSTKINPHNDSTNTEHGFVSIIPASDSTFLSIWLDGRNTQNIGSHDDHSNSEISNAMTLRSALIKNDLTILEENLLDNSVCDCCGTAIAQTENGFIAAYRNRTSDEVRDISIISYKNGEWSEPTIVHNDNWKIAACPVNGPSIASLKNKVALAWFTGANDTSKVNLTLSNNNGESFNKTVRIDHGQPLGRVDVDILDNESILVSWLERDQNDRGKASFIIKEFTKDGNLSNEHVVASLSSSRRSGFPQISKSGNSLIVAWTDLEGDDPQIYTSLLSE